MDAGLKKRGRLVVSIDRLKEDPSNERRTFRNMEGLIASIKAVGLIEPITVTARGRGGRIYRIVTGHRRYRAAKAAGLSQVEVLIREPDDELTRRVKSIISNVQREDVGPVEMAEALASRSWMKTSGSKPRTTWPRLIGKDKTWVSGMLRILDLAGEAPAESWVNPTFDSVRRDDPHRPAGRRQAPGATHRPIAHRRHPEGNPR